MDEKLEVLKRKLKEMGSVLIAYSGGVDSTFLLKVAKEALGEGVLAVIARSPIHPEWEYREAKRVADSLRVRLVELQTDELSRPEFVRNLEDRCYWCKRWLFEGLKEIAEREGIQWVVDGSNLDDLDEFRPGMKARDELGVRSPLCEARLSKGEIRRLSQRLGLFTWNKPSFSCLATRIPYGNPITLEALRRVGGAEEILLSMGFREIRVRDHGEIARIEIREEEMQRLMNRKEEIIRGLKEIGYHHVTLDLEGRS